MTFFTRLNNLKIDILSCLYGSTIFLHNKSFITEYIKQLDLLELILYDLSISLSMINVL